MDSTCGAAVPPASTVQVCFPGARSAVMDNLNRQREEGRLCDLSIQVQGQVFRAHRCVLAASSPYFHDQVLLKNVTTVSLPSVMDPLAFESVLSSAYTGQLSIVHDDIVNYVTVASFLQMWHIVDKCTEILKRPRPAADVSAGAPHGSASRQQSPSSTDCLYLETEGRRKDRKTDALPPLATWRRPQQFSRCWRLRPSQLDAVPHYADSDYSGGEDAWTSAHSSRHHGAAAGDRKGRPQKGAAPQSTDRNRDGVDGVQTPLKKKNEKREIEADEGVGEDEDEKDKFGPAGHCGPRPLSDDTVDVMKVQRTGSDAVHGCETGEDGPSCPAPSCPAPSCPAPSCPAPSCPGSGRVQWQTGPWSDPRLQDDEDEEDFGCFPGGTFSRGTYDEIEDGTGQVSQRPLVPASPDVTMATSEGSWSSRGGQGGSDRHASPSSVFPPPSSPPTPSSSSSVSLAGAPYTGKVHFCHCGKAYTLKSMRDRHVKMQHLNLRPFGCPVCTKSFKMKHHLTKHLKTHGGLRPYECRLCGKKVVWRDSFLRHQARCERLASSAHSGTAGPPAPDLDHGYGFGFQDHQVFVAAGGQVKVEEDFQVDMEDGIGLLGAVSGIPALDAGSHVFKEEASGGFRGK